MEEISVDGEVIAVVDDEEPIEEQAEPTGTILVPLEVLRTIEAAPAGQEILNVCIATAHFLSEKNVSYGNSALEPIRIFAKEINPMDQLRVRIDDKISRLAKGNDYMHEDTYQDLLGYLVLYFVARSRQDNE